MISVVTRSVFHAAIWSEIFFTEKGKFYLKKNPEGSEWVEIYSCTLSLAFVIDWDGWLTPRSGRFTIRNDAVPKYWSLGWPHGRSGRARKNSPPTDFDPRTVHPVASRYIDYAIPALFSKEQVPYIYLWWMTLFECVIIAVFQFAQSCCVLVLKDKPEHISVPCVLHQMAQSYLDSVTMNGNPLRLSESPIAIFGYIHCLYSDFVNLLIRIFHCFSHCYRISCWWLSKHSYTFWPVNFVPWCSLL
jgi:hypothetical protein